MKQVAPAVRASAARYARDPLLLGLTLFTIVAVGAYFSGVGSNHARVLGYWVTQPPLDLLLALACWRVARSGNTPAPARRFFRAFAATGSCFVVGDTIQQPRRSTGESGDDGRFVVCGAALDQPMLVRAATGSLSATAVIEPRKDELVAVTLVLKPTSPP